MRACMHLSLQLFIHPSIHPSTLSFKKHLLSAHHMPDTVLALRPQQRTKPAKFQCSGSFHSREWREYKYILISGGKEAKKENKATQGDKEGPPWWLCGKECACQCRRHRFDPWVRKIPWRRKWQPTPVFLPGKFHRQRSLVGYNSWGCKRVRRNLVTNQLS